jgi:ATP-binding cassette subfamily C protein
MKRFLSVVKNLTRLLETVKSHAIIALIILIFKGLTEGVGLLFIIPLLSIAGISQLDSSSSGLVQFIHQAFETTGLSITVNSVLIIYFIIMSFYALLGYFQSVNTTKINQNVALEWRNIFFKKVTYSKWSILQRIKRSDLQEILTLEIRRLSSISNQSIQVVGSLILIGVYLGLSFLLSFQLTLFSVFPIGLLLLLNRPINKKTYKIGGDTVRNNKAMHSVILEHLNALKLVKTYQKEIEHLADFEGKSYATEEQNMRFVKSTNKTKLFFELLAALIIVVYIYVAIVFIDVPITEVLLLIFIFARLLPKVSKVVNNFQQILNTLPSFETTLEVIEQLEQEEESGAKTKFNSFKNAISVESVSFSYEDKKVLDEINCSIQANKTTVILGPSGKGKSTLVDLIIGLQEPESGIMKIDNFPLQNIHPNDWRSKIALVPQDAFLFHESIHDNLLWAKPNASVEDINLALKQAGAFDFIQNLPHGLKTIVGDSGTKLSGGERQRIALARALITKPQILILDEATNAIDDATEEVIKNSLSDLKGKMTIIIVAHRSSLVELADHIIEL